MKKFVSIVISLILFTVLFVQSASATNDMQEAYRRILNQYISEQGGDYIYYTLFDIDNNGSKELIIDYGGSDGSIAYGYNNGIVEDYGYCAGNVKCYYQKNNNLYALCFSLQQIETHYVTFEMWIDKIILNNNKISYQTIYHNPSYRKSINELDQSSEKSIPEVAEFLNGAKEIDFLNIRDQSLLEKSTQIKVILNDTELFFDQPPVIINDRVMVPIRTIFETMGYNVNWDSETQTATAIKSNNKIIVQINNNIIQYTINGISGTYECDVVPQIISEKTLVPVRAIAESAGCNVQWDGNISTAIIAYNSQDVKHITTRALLLAGYDTQKNAKIQKRQLGADRLSVDYVEESLSFLNVREITKHYMEDDKKYMSASEFVKTLQDTFEDATDDDLSIIYYSGHTYTNHTTLFSGISFQKFYNLIKNNVKGTVLLMYDGCFAGELLNLHEYDNRIKIIAACDEDDYSFSYCLAKMEGDSDDNQICSLFAYALYNGAINNTNYLDSNNDKTVTFDELYVYLLNSVYNICDRITTQEYTLNRLKDMLGLDSAVRMSQIVQSYPNADETPLFMIK